MTLVLEIEKILFKFTGIRKVREPRLEMLNAYFNLYTDKTGKNRPKLVNFKKVLKNMYKNGLSDQLSMTRMPWLRTQGAPIVTKGVFKPKPDSTYSTTTISPYGRVELLGVKSISSMKEQYKHIVKTFNELPSDVKEPSIHSPNENNKPKRKYVKKNKIIPSVSLLNTFVFKKQSGSLLINNKKCETFEKPTLIEIAKRFNITTRGTRKTLCESILNLI